MFSLLQGLHCNLQPKYKNVKEEVLDNVYKQLSIENWNKTLTEVTQFKKSFAVQRMRTQSNGTYHDDAMGLEETWKRGEVPSMKELIVIKLYTDWDELQSELKKCFRIESGNVSCVYFIIRTNT